MRKIYREQMNKWEEKIKDSDDSFDNQFNNNDEND